MSSKPGTRTKAATDSSPAKELSDQDRRSRRPSSLGRLSLLFGNVAVELGYLTLEQVQRCIRLQQTAQGGTPIGEICLREGLFGEPELIEILAEQKRRLVTARRTGRARLGHSLVKRCVRRPPAGAEEEAALGGSSLVTRATVQRREGSDGTHALAGRRRRIDWMLGQVWGPFEIEGVLGEGGMGAVFLARNMLLRRRVALKVPFEADLRRPDDQARFLTEARSAACLDHPNVIRIHSVGDIAGLPYIEMEYAPGRTLDAVINEGLLTTTGALRIFTQVCHGVAAAHDQGIVHRDLKPDNILCCDDGRVLVMDFGLARQIRGTLGPKEAKVLVGTVGFIAPEQLRGKRPDQRSDIYSLGALLFNVLANRLPFVGDLPVQIFVAQLTTPAPLLRDLAPELPGWIEELLCRMLDPRPEARHQSIEELLAELREGQSRWRVPRDGPASQ